LSNDPTINRVAKAICARETGYSGGPNVCGNCREARYDPEYGTPVDVPEGCLGLGYTYLAEVALTAAASPPHPDALKLAEIIAETIWRSEYRRATDKERSIPWSEVASADQEKYRFVARGIFAAIRDAYYSAAPDEEQT
jgi:hypothetical protein